MIVICACPGDGHLDVFSSGTGDGAASVVILALPYQSPSMAMSLPLQPGAPGAWLGIDPGVDYVDAEQSGTYDVLIGRRLDEICAAVRITLTTGRLRGSAG